MRSKFQTKRRQEDCRRGVPVEVVLIHHNANYDTPFDQPYDTFYGTINIEYHVFDLF